MRIKTIIALALFFIAVYVTGCTTNPTTSSSSEEPEHSSAQPLVAMAFYHDDKHYYIKYLQDKHILYANSTRPEYSSLAEDSSSQTYSTPQLLVLQNHQESAWKNLPDDLKGIPILDAGMWKNLRDRLLRAVMPDDGTGLVMDFENTEYFLFYDQQGNFHSTRLIDKPAEYRIRGNLEFETFMSRSFPILENYLVEHGITDAEFVFNTGDSDLYALPFLYVDTENRKLVFFRNVPARTTLSSMPGTKTGRAIGHVLRSHMSDLYIRPLSSFYRLFFVVTDTTVSTLRFDWATALSDKPVPDLGNEPPMDLQHWESELDKIANYPTTRGSVEILVDGQAFFNRFIDTVNSAQKSIHIQTYIFDDDDYALDVAELLKRRSNEGVEVKVLLDGLGSITATMADPSNLPEQYKPPISMPIFLREGSRVEVRQKTNPWFTSDHVKATIIDNRIAFIGGMNIGREYRYEWHDLMVELQGPIINIINKEFHSAWTQASPLGDFGYLISKASHSDQADTSEGYALRVLLTKPGKHEIYQAQLEAIRHARSYIYIQNAYLTDDRILRELVMARRRGVDVRVIIPMETDHGPITRSNVLAANAMIENGIRVFIYPGFSHVKAAIIDGWVCIGSANLDRLSLRINRELNIASSDQEMSKQLLEKLFLPDFQASPELTEKIPKSWADHLVELIGDYIY